jgi:MoaD family protein
MEVRFFANFIDITGSSTCQVDGPHTVYSLVEALCLRFGEPMARLLLNEQGEPLHEDLFVLVNGRHIRQLNGLQTELAPTDVISIVPVIEAG